MIAMVRLHRKSSEVHRLIACCLALALLASCGCFGQSRVATAKLDPKAIAERAISAYDKDGDHKLGPTELAAWPAMHSTRERNDKNSDGFVTADELEARVRQWQEAKIGLMTVQCTVLLDGQPLKGALVRLVPDACMGSGAEPAEGETNSQGSAAPVVTQTKLPGVRPGFYRVEITSKEISLPARYNTSTELGLEAAPDAPETVMTTFQLTRG
jgi:hypothetical protein